MSLTMSLARAVLARRPKTLTSVETAQKRVAERDAPAAVSRALLRSCHVEEETVGGFPVITLTPREKGSGTELVYLHGGAYIAAIIPAHWAFLGKVVAQTGATVTVPLYGLAPEHTVDDAFAFVPPVIEAVRRRAAGRPVFLGGDSAGGGLSVGLALHGQDVDGLVLIAPWLDPSASNPVAPGLVEIDPMLEIPGAAWAGQQWAGPHDVTDTRVSPIFADPTGLPRTLVLQGGHDVLLADTLKFCERAMDAGVDLRFRVEPSGFHVYPAATFTPEARRAVKLIAEFMRG
ncbi:alpha/beta hydrolase [Aeromicrobium alkaliterrae]|uniref:Alpha/beta hydrolase n=1 Tax=Aeromicrobium alkaliterrae TaxID=302168 RepID=A0ABP4VFT0_9ACTN